MERKRRRFSLSVLKMHARSQMAQGFAERLGKGKIRVYSAGSRPASQIDPLVIEVMNEKGIDLSAKRPKGLNDLPSIEMDYLITMGCEETCPAVPAKKIVEWEIPDPKGKSLDAFRNIRDIIEERVRTRTKKNRIGIGWSEVWVDGYKDLEKEISKHCVDFSMACKQPYQRFRRFL